MPRVRTVVRVVLSLGLSCAFLWSAFRSVDLSALSRAVGAAAPAPLLGAAVVLLLTIFPRALRWRILIAPLDPRASLRVLCGAVLVAYAGNNVFPRAGELARVLVVRRSSPAGAGGLLATVLVERVIDLLSLLAVAAAVTLLRRDAIAAAFPGLGAAATAAFAACLAALVAFAALSAWGHRGTAAVKRLLARVSPSLAHRLAGPVDSFLDGMAAVRSPAGYAAIAGWTVLLNAGYALALYLPFLSFGFDTKYGLGPVDALVVLVVATVGIILPAPGGAGTYHYFCSRTLTGLYGIPLEEALAFATVVHAVGYCLFLLAGGPGLVRLLWRRKAEGVGG